MGEAIESIDWEKVGESLTTKFLVPLADNQNVTNEVFVNASDSFRRENQLGN